MIIVAGAVVAGLVAWFVRAVLTAPVVNEWPAACAPRRDEVIVTPQGVEIPVAWLANAEDLDEVVATLRDIDRLGTGAAA